MIKRNCSTQTDPPVEPEDDGEAMAGDAGHAVVPRMGFLHRLAQARKPESISAGPIWPVAGLVARLAMDPACELCEEIGRCFLRFNNAAPRPPLMPAQAGIQFSPPHRMPLKNWIPACAGMSGRVEAAFGPRQTKKKGAPRQFPNRPPANSFRSSCAGDGRRGALGQLGKSNLDRRRLRTGRRPRSGSGCPRRRAWDRRDRASPPSPWR